LIQTNTEDLPMDTAQVRIENSILDKSFQLNGIPTCCYKCSKLFIAQVQEKMNFSEYASISSRCSIDFEIVELVNNSVVQRLEFSHVIGEHGAYSIAITHNAEQSIFHTVDEDRPSDNEYLPLIIFGSGLVLIVLIWGVVTFFLHKNQDDDKFVVSNGRVEIVGNNRVKSVDAFRGFCVALMIFVNYGGGGYWIFEISAWNGVTAADFVFPWFIFLVGLTIPLSFEPAARIGYSKARIFSKVVKRSIILFALGLFVNNGSDLAHWRILGVLQRVSISYLITSTIVIFVPVFVQEKLPSEDTITTGLLDSRKLGKRNYYKDLTPHWLQSLVALLLPVIHLVITLYLPVPNCPTGYLGPGGISDYGKDEGCTGGAAGYIDRVIIGVSHMSQTPSCQQLYHCSGFDPENILGFLNSAFTCFLGVHAGRVLTMFKNQDAKLRRWGIWGVVLMGIAVGICQAQDNIGWIPINRNLWSLSFTFLMGGSAFVALVVFYILIEYLNMWQGAPFTHMGRNALLIYLGHLIFMDYFPFSFYTDDVQSSHALSLISNVCGLVSWGSIAFFLHRQNFYVKV